MRIVAQVMEEPIRTWSHGGTELLAQLPRCHRFIPWYETNSSARTLGRVPELLGRQPPSIVIVTTTLTRLHSQSGC